MRTRIRRVCTFTLLSLLSLFDLVAQAGAQDSVRNQLNGSQTSRPKTGESQKATIAAAATGYTYSAQSFSRVTIASMVLGTAAALTSPSGIPCSMYQAMALGSRGASPRPSSSFTFFWPAL
jgi:hypothetical protein